MGGLVWTKKVADYIEKRQVLNVKKISNEINFNQTHILQIFKNIKDAFKGLFTNPDIAILDSYGEANLMIWLLLRIFKPYTRILTTFHHYEPRVSTRVKRDGRNIFATFYNTLI